MERAERTHPAEKVMDEIRQELKNYDEAYYEHKELGVIKDIRTRIKSLIEQLHRYFAQSRVDA